MRRTKQKIPKKKAQERWPSVDEQAPRNTSSSWDRASRTKRMNTDNKTPNEKGRNKTGEKGTERKKWDETRRRKTKKEKEKENGRTRTKGGEPP